MALPTLETERFIIRPMAPGDVDLMVEIDTDPEITKFIGGPLSEDEVRNEFQYYLHRDDEKAHGHWCVVDKASGDSHGCILVKPMPLEEPDGRLFPRQGCGNRLSDLLGQGDRDRGLKAFSGAAVWKSAWTG